MAVPRWDDPVLKAGTMIRSALWLVAEIGEGNTFTKEQLRDAFPGVSQADRRMRDLRDYAWVIYTNTDDATLKPEEQRFVKAGLEVWKPEVRHRVASKAISAKQRRATFAADGFQCVVCGIAGGEHYPDSPIDSAVLSATRRLVVLPGGETEEQLVTECKRCRSGADQSEVSDMGRLLDDIRHLDEADQAQLVRWIKRGKREPTPVDRTWTAFRRQPSEARAEILRQLQD